MNHAPSSIPAVQESITLRTERDFARDVQPLRPDLMRRALFLTRSSAEADDLVQDTLLRAWLYYRSFETGTNLRAWLQRILFTTFINTYRKNKRAAVLLSDDGLRMAVDRASIERAASAGNPEEELPDALRSAVDDLPTIFRSVLLHVDLEEASYEEAAKKLGCPVGTIMSRLHRARARMRKSLAEAGVVDLRTGFAA